MADKQMPVFAAARVVRVTRTLLCAKQRGCLYLAPETSAMGVLRVVMAGQTS